ncbi:MAG: beta-agarase [Lentisphaerae bacterium]|jgi:hypothetical protein|nr:beta-agarase [Lentisphaerota bacterium]MBT4815206.1 beta-agarase [Lentisphaerota bacterium]MBT5609176.1 beta-agarase [Lentisphaerota bacterium]MBT7053620.1 beta-agarase [Lentisphaerota bacterium]MBT7845721.1 beta-agarase [Lentisphaerota bacterium]
MERESQALAATGYVRVEQIDGVWWFIGPDGERFVSMGVNHIEPHLWLAPYNRQATLERYGEDMVSADGFFDTRSVAAQKWIDRQIETCADLHFNTFAKHTHPSIDSALYRDKIYYIASLETAPLAGWRERNGEGPRPDVFSTDFRRFVERRVQSMCAQHRNSRNLLGYIYTDIPSWILGKWEQQPDQGPMIYPWVNAILPLGETSPGKWKWLEHLQQRYVGATEAAEVWGHRVSSAYGISWERMARLVDWSKPTDPARAQEDMLAFMPTIVEQWYALHHDLVREHDPNHLILGDKNMVMWYYDWTLPAIRKYTDVVTIQAYGRWSEDGKTTDQLYETLGKPIFNGDGSFGFAGPNQQKLGIKGFRTGARSIGEVAEFYRETLIGMMAKPYILGWHHCGFLEQWDECERGDAPMNENGFMDPFENYHTEWTDVIREINAQAHELHTQAAG